MILCTVVSILIRQLKGRWQGIFTLGFNIITLPPLSNQFINHFQIKLQIWRDTPHTGSEDTQAWDTFPLRTSRISWTSRKSQPSWISTGARSPWKSWMEYPWVWLFPVTRSVESDSSQLPQVQSLTPCNYQLCKVHFLQIPTYVQCRVSEYASLKFSTVWNLTLCSYQLSRVCLSPASTV